MLYTFICIQHRSMKIIASVNIPVKKVYVIHTPSILLTPFTLPFFLPASLSSLSCICKEKMEEIKIGNEILMELPFVKFEVMFVLVFPF